MTAGPEYHDGRYRAERRRNPLVQTPSGGRLLSAVMLPWFTIRPPKGCGVLTTIGRKTGNPRRRCVRVYRTGDKAYLIAISGEHNQWLKNIRADPAVGLRIRGGSFEGIARDLGGPDERAEAEAGLCEISTRSTISRTGRIARVGRPERRSGNCTARGSRAACRW